MFVTNCLRAANGVIISVPPLHETGYLKAVSEKDISISVTDYGLEVHIREIVIPVPEYIIDFLAENPTVTVYLADPSQYMWEPEFAVELSKEGIVEARGVYKHLKRAEKNQATVNEQ